MILLVAGTRPELIKMNPIYRVLKEREARVRMVVVAQQQDLVRLHLHDYAAADLWKLELPSEARGSLDTILGPMLLELHSVMMSVPKGTVVGVQGDTLTTFAGALTGSQCGHPVVHVEAGLRTSRIDRPYPEEWIRRAVSRMATWHCAPTHRAVQNLEREGATRIQYAGNTAVDALWNDLPRALPMQKNRGLVLVTCHRRESWTTVLPALVQAVAEFAATHPDAKVLWPVHPNPVVDQAVNRLRDVPNVALTLPMQRHDFLVALWRANVIVTDSGGVIEEATTLGRPTLIIRDETERPEAIESGSAVLVPFHAMLNLPRLIASALHAPCPKPSAVFGDGTAGVQIADLMLSLQAMHA